MRQCKAKSKRTQKRCKNPAMIDMKVCYHHGGVLGTKKAREAKRKAALKHEFYTKKAIKERKSLSIFMKQTKDMIANIK